MAISRKHALKRLQGLFPEVQSHMEQLAAEVESKVAAHWKHEIRNWLQQMEEVLPHVGQKTAEEWQARIQACRDALAEG